MLLNNTYTYRNSFRLLLAVVFSMLCLVSKAQNHEAIYDSANASYSKANYEKALELYQGILSDNKEAWEIYYNIGNCYYKTNNIAYAILNYERAKKLNPGNEDVTYNLALANKKVEDKMDEMPELFINKWKNGIINAATEKTWSILFILSLSLSLLLFAVYYASPNRNNKQIGFFGGAIILIVSVLLFFTAKSKYNHSLSSKSAIITSSSVTVTGSPSEESTKLFILHEGSKVNISKKSDNWAEIKLANGNVGWVKLNELEEI